MKLINNQIFTGERSLFNSKNLKLKNVTFGFGESPLKESTNLSLDEVTFTYKYPLWYSRKVKIINSKFIDTARSGIWYTSKITILDSEIDIEKTFRRSKKITLKNVKMSNAKETLWHCNKVKLKNVTINGDYFGMDSKNIKADSIKIDGNYCFDGAKNVHIKNSTLNSKDAFWNCENVFVEDSIINGEYIGWNSKNVTFRNCIITSNQGFCYMKNLHLIDCIFQDVTLAFEFSTVRGNVENSITSIKNPLKLKLKCEKVEELILESKYVDKNRIRIIEEHNGKI